MKEIINTIIVLIAITVFSSGTALAYDSNQVATVSMVEGTYMPGSAFFQLNGGQCGWYKWLPHGDTEEKRLINVKTIYSSLMTALVSGRSVRVYTSPIPNTDQCSVEYIHFL